MTRATTGIEDAPRPSIALLNMLGDRRRDIFEMPCVEECCPMPQLLRAVATHSRLATPAAYEIDVALTGQIEAVTIAADECAGRGG